MEPRPTYELTTLSPADIQERWWLAFTPDHDPTAAAERFIDHTGAPPVYLVRTPTLLLVGPLARRPTPPPQIVKHALDAPVQASLF